MCCKRGYRSKRAALLAHGRAGFRVRVYLCTEGCSRPWHVTNADRYEPPHYRQSPRWRGHGHLSRPPAQLAPERTLAELEELAREKRKRAAAPSRS